MSTELEYPKIRFVDVFPVDTGNGQLFGLRDPSGIAPRMLLLSPDVIYLLQFFDGKHSLLDLRTEYMHAFGNFLYEEQLTQIISNLNEHFFLENDAFFAKRRLFEQEFLNAPVRSAAHAGQSYEAQPEKLQRELESFFRGPSGPGLPRQNSKKNAIKGLVAPHIDIRAGGACYAHAYKALAEAAPVDCFVILGTGHSGLENLYSVLAKDFETPLGNATCDLEFVKKLKSNYPALENSEVLPHKTEHTIEFQLIFLKHLFQSQRDFTFVPILCSFSYHIFQDERFAREKKIVADFSDALRKTISQFGKKVCLIASVDLAHVGLRYGEQLAPDKEFLSGVSKADRQLMTAVENLDSDGFYHSIADKKDCYRVCGFSPIYTLLRAIDAERGQLLNYSNTVVDTQNSTVTFASMAFY